jgi:hypothetical protein
MEMKTYIFKTTITGEFSIRSSSTTDAIDRMDKISQQHKNLTINNIEKIDTHFDRVED